MLLRAAWGVARALTEATTESARTRHLVMDMAAAENREEGRTDFIARLTRKME